MKRQWIEILDPIRIILAFWVLMSHNNLRHTLLDFLKPETFIEKATVSLAGSAFVGVAAVIGFFILSGLVIHLPYTGKKEIKITSFYLSRITRIVLPMMVAIIMIESLGSSYKSLPLWSLVCEIIYYFIYPFLRKISNYIGWKKLFIITFVLSYLVMFIEGTAILDTFSKEPEALGGYWYLGDGLTWLIGLPCWLLGVLIAENYENIINISVTFRKIIFIRSLIIIASVICNHLLFRFNINIALTLNIFALFAYYWFTLEIAYYHSRKVKLKLLVWASRWTYSLYITHAIVMYITESIFPSINPFELWIINLVGALAFAICFYYAVEYPAHKLSRYLGKMELKPKPSLKRV